MPQLRAYFGQVLLNCLFSPYWRIVGRHEDRVVSVGRRPRLRVPPVDVFHELLVDGRNGRTDLVSVEDFHVHASYEIICIGSFQILSICFFFGNYTCPDIITFVTLSVQNAVRCLKTKYDPFLIY